jgi:uncharacterized protein YydD (DUF2326 family)
MLIEIACEKFRDKIVSFHDGLNVILGDDNATNSIGKSTLLMIIDFVLGGSSLLEHNHDVVDELGHHDYFVTFKFGAEQYQFSRGTLHPNTVYVRGEGGSLEEAIDLERYTATLKSLYGITAEDVSFRRMVGLFSRVWGKPNIEVTRPLHAVPGQSDAECVDTLIRTFNQYGTIQKLVDSLKKAVEDEQNLKRAFRSEVIRKVGAREYRENAQKIEELESEIREIKENLAMFALNISEIANREMQGLKEQKDELLAAKLDVESKLKRVRRNLRESRFIRSRSFEGLKELFPAINSERLAEIETFHSSLAKVLKGELKESERRLSEQLTRISAELDAINARLMQKLGALESPAIVVDRVFEVSTGLHEAKQQNLYHDRLKEFTDTRRLAEEALTQRKLAVLKRIEDQINLSIRDIVERVFGPERKSPILSLEEDRYSFQVYEDTGAGVAYSSLIVLDLAIFGLSELPLLVHDSVLFKNIENTAVSRLLEFYKDASKQSFVALDEVRKYGAETATMLRECAVITLQNDHVLYVKDWRKQKQG